MNDRRRRLLRALSGTVRGLREQVRRLERVLDDSELRERQMTESTKREYARQHRRRLHTTEEDR